MDIIQIASEIEKKINEIEKWSQSLGKRIEESALASAEYDAKIAETLIKLFNGVEFQHNGQTIKQPPATLSDKIARGLCWQEGLKKDKANLSLKAAQDRLDALQSQLNGWQSIYRHLNER